VEEYLFLLSNMDVVIRMKDAELVGEFLQALHILDTPHEHPVMQKGYHFLIGAEKKGKMRGNWVPSSAPFYQRYHAAYCGIIGLAEFVFDPTESDAHQIAHASHANRVPYIHVPIFHGPYSFPLLSAVTCAPPVQTIPGGMGQVLRVIVVLCAPLARILTPSLNCTRCLHTYVLSIHFLVHIQQLFFLIFSWHRCRDPSHAAPLTSATKQQIARSRAVGLELCMS